MRAHLEDAYAEAIDARKQFEQALKGILPPIIPWSVIEDYATAKAREILARDKLERCGFL